MTTRTAASRSRQPSSVALSENQRNLLVHARRQAEGLAAQARPTLAKLASSAGWTERELEEGIQSLREAPLTLNFHPGTQVTHRETGQNSTVLERLVADGEYLPLPALEARGWTARGKHIPAEFYSTIIRDTFCTDLPLEPSEYPVFGFLTPNLEEKPVGNTGHYGTSLMVVRPELRARATLGVPDNVAPVGTFEHPEHVLLHEARLTGGDGLHSLLERATTGRTDRLPPALEYHGFGGHRFAQDIEQFHLSYRDMETPLVHLGQDLPARTGVPVQWVLGDTRVGPEAVEENLALREANPPPERDPFFTPW